MDHQVPVFHFSLPKYFMKALERVQKRATQCPLSALVVTVMRPSILLSTFEELATHHDEICETLFDTIIVKDTL